MMALAGVKLEMLVSEPDGLTLDHLYERKRILASLNPQIAMLEKLLFRTNAKVKYSTFFCVYKNAVWSHF